MVATILHKGKTIRVDFFNPIDISMPLDVDDKRTKAWYVNSVKIEPVKIGIGINTGYAVIGNMGSESRFDYTAIGDAVNTAARLESATKEKGVDLLIGENTEKLCGLSLKELKSIKVKGKSKELKIFTLEKI